MGISDWSSDVCSSDLDRFALQRADRARERQCARCAGNVDVAARDAGMAGEESQRVHATHRIADQAGQALDAQRPDHGMRGVGAALGNGACREVGCKYVVIWVVAVSLNKKKQK